LQKAEKTNSTITLEISRLTQSRKTNHISKQYPTNNNSSKCEHCTKNIKATIQQQSHPNKNRIQSDSLALRNDYFSPIIEFEDYSLNNEPTIPEEDHFQKTSQFGRNYLFRKTQPAVCEQSSQTELCFMEPSHEEIAIDEEINQLQSTIAKNNSVIANY
jgi:hypothetical protein